MHLITCKRNTNVTIVCSCNGEETIRFLLEWCGRLYTRTIYTIGRKEVEGSEMADQLGIERSFVAIFNLNEDCTDFPKFEYSEFKFLYIFVLIWPEYVFQSSFCSLY